MISNITIRNYKSILNESFPLGNVNVFIGENGCGKSNILEAVAMFCASKDNDLSDDGLFNRGIRIAKSALTFSSFIGLNSKKTIDIIFEKKENSNKPDFISAKLYCNNAEEIYAKWRDKNVEDLYKQLPNIFNFTKSKMPDLFKSLINPDFSGSDFEIPDDVSDEEINQKMQAVMMNILPNFTEEIYGKEITDFLIFNLNSNTLRGFNGPSKKTPLGINGEGLDVLLSNFSNEEMQSINKYNCISWLKNIKIDKDDYLKRQGYKLGRSTSNLYFADKFMRRNNNFFSAENANEGALYILFYLALFISKKTPSFFAVDNIETALNPKLCRDLITSIAELSKENQKQALITTHNPAVLDGLNLHDETQKLFVVRRTDEGYTKIDQVKLKPKSKNKNEKLKLSEMWMRGYLGGLSTQNF